eukprot:9502301-Pyramimonas_sp.AAC.3
MAPEITHHIDLVGSQLMDSECVPGQIDVPSRIALPATAAAGLEDSAQIVVDESMVPARTKQKYINRSWEHVRHARDCKKARRQEAIIEKQSQQLKAADARLQVAAALAPAVSTTVGSAPSRIGRKSIDQLIPQDFTVLTRAVFVKPTVGVALGIKHQRVIAAAAGFLLERQQGALFSMITVSKNILQKFECARAHVCFTHLWDETRVKFRRFQETGRGTKMGTFVQTMAQRGYLSMTLLDRTSGEYSMARETWLIKPIEVEGTSAAALLPGIEKAIPYHFCLRDFAALARALRSISHVSIMPMCDKASGNISLMKFWGHSLSIMMEQMPTIAKRVLYWPDCCGVHLHHRGKVSLTALREHTMRSYSIANLYRLQDVRAKMVSGLEFHVRRKLKRKVEPPPREDTALDRFCHIIFDLDAEYHRRGHNYARRSQFHTDLQFLCQMVNCDIGDDQPWVHYCWDADSSGPCCANDEVCKQNSVVACLNAMLGKTDPIPGESRWTHVLPNFRMLCLRRVVFNVGLECFDLSVGAQEADLAYS